MDYTCCICGKYMHHGRTPDQWVATKDGDFMWLHRECYERMCKGEHRASAEVGRAVSGS